MSTELQPEAEAQYRRLTVMIVDDVPANLHLLTYILSQDNYEVRTMQGGEQALASAFANPPDLILLDIRMPHMDGHTVCTRLKQNPLTKDIPVLFISALQETEDKLKAFEVGGVDYIAKPFQQAEVLARVRAHLGILQAQRELECEVQRRTAAEREASRQRELLALIDRMRAQFIRQPQQTLMFEGLLADILAFTGSAFGFIGERQADKKGEPQLHIHALSNIAWSDETRALYSRWRSGEGLLFDNLDTLFGYVLTSGAPVIANDPVHHSAARGLPPGHPALDAFLGVPLYFGSELIGIIGLANRSDGYSQKLVDELQPLLSACAQVMAASREQLARHQAEARLRDSELQLRELTENIRQVFWMSTHDGSQMLYVSPVVESLLGHSVAESMQTPWVWRQSVLEADQEQLDQAHRQLLERGSFDIEYRLTQPGGEIRWIRERAFPVHNDEGDVQRVAGLAEDVTALHQAQEQIWYQATHDALTGLCNRKQFHDRLHQQVASARREGGRFALFYLDLDGFKQVNDTYGHALGDALLIEVACRLQAEVREEDTLARLGGDEFAILLPNLDDEQAARSSARRIVGALVDELVLDGLNITTACSLGIAFYPDQGDDEEALLRAADQAMYSAKRQGRGQYRMAPSCPSAQD